ncbi:metal ABC transporter permease [Thorsellia kenyensis]|uniref:Metal ABC transporter permease n=1 Tax=Thorsellia kenyensis TaxID=1549888 RepID=A0ABV6CA66_9GAMM
MYDFIIYLIEPFYLPFIQRALLLGITIGIVCAVLSCYLVLKGWALIGDALSHSLLPGVLLSHMFGLSIFIGALCAAILSTTLMGVIKRKTKLKEDTIVGIVFSVMFAMGLFLFSVIDTELHITHLLFGNILGIDRNSLLTHLIILVCILAIICLKARDLMLFCFDEKQLTMQGMSIKFHHYLLLFLLSVVLVVSIQAIGVLFVIGLLIIPGMFGYSMTKQFHFMMMYASFFSALTIFIGILVSFYLDVASAPLIIVIQTLFLLLTFALTSRITKNKQI